MSNNMIDDVTVRMQAVNDKTSDIDTHLAREIGAELVDDTRRNITQARADELAALIVADYRLALTLIAQEALRERDDIMQNAADARLTECESDLQNIALACMKYVIES